MVTHTREPHITDDFPLYTLLSRVLIAFTIEVDNEFEHRMAELGSKHFRLSLPMWSNHLRLVGAGLAVREFEGRAGLLNHFLWWRYVTIAPRQDDLRSKPPRPDWLVTLTEAGETVRDVLPTLISEIESRWDERFGKAELDELRSLLRGMVERLDLELPQYVPVLGYGLKHRGRTSRRDELPGVTELNLPALLSMPLSAFTIELEESAAISLAIYTDVVKHFEIEPQRVRDLPQLGNVSREAVNMAVGWLKSGGYAELFRESGDPRSERIRLTEKGAAAAADCVNAIDRLERGYETRFPARKPLRDLLYELLTRERGGKSVMAGGLHPPQGGWRGEGRYLAQTKAFLESPLDGLPQFPMVLHRGGWPDGA